MPDLDVYEFQSKTKNQVSESCVWFVMIGHS